MRLPLRDVVLVLGAGLLLTAPAAAANVKAGSKTVAYRNVSATLSWSAGQYSVAENPRLKVTRDGATVLDADLTKACDLCVGLGDPKHALALRDLEGDGEPEVTVDLFSGGAHCCWTLLIYRLAPTGPPGYDATVASWGNGGYVLKQLDGDGVAEIVSTDDRFAYEFTAYVGSWRPPMIFNFTGGTLVDVTRRFPARIRSDLRELDASLPQAKKFGDARGLVAARVAEMYLLGQGAKVKAYLNRMAAHGYLKGPGPYPAGATFRRALMKFLKQTGYRT